MKKYLVLILLILISCQPDELLDIDPISTTNMIFNQSISKVGDGQSFSFEIVTAGKYELLITTTNGSVITKESFDSEVGVYNKQLYTKILPKGELYLILQMGSNEIQKTSIIVE